MWYIWRIQHKENMHGSSLDYDKIKKDLKKGNERTKGLLLQALRWVIFIRHTYQLIIAISEID